MSFGTPYAQYLFSQKKNAAVLYANISAGALSIAMGAILIFYFGIIGAALSVVMGNLAIQMASRYYARKYGCSQFEGWGLLNVTALLAGMYIFDLLFPLLILMRIAIWLVISSIIFVIYNFYSDLLNIGERLQNHFTGKRALMLEARLPEVLEEG